MLENKKYCIICLESDDKVKHYCRCEKEFGAYHKECLMEYMKKTQRGKCVMCEDEFKIYIWSRVVDKGMEILTFVVMGVYCVLMILFMACTVYAKKYDKATGEFYLSYIEPSLAISFCVCVCLLVAHVI